jgi:putative transposase
MQLVEQHIIKSNNIFFNECDSLCFKSKNLYNSCLYIIRQAYINDKVNLLYDLHLLMKNSEQYKALPTKVSSTVLLMVQKNFKSYFKANAEYYKTPAKFKVKPRLPNYLDIVNGRYFTSYTNQAISKKVFKASNKIKLSNSIIEFYTKITDFRLINCVRIIPKLGYYVIEVVYTIVDKPLLLDNNQYLSIDLGVNNLATLTSNNREFKPVIINGKPLKSMNQYNNKKSAERKSVLELRNGRKTSKFLKKLNLKRKNKVDNYLHKASKIIVELAKSANINTIIIGKNDNWKQETNMSKANNQNFVNIPHSRFIEMITYKCELQGINIILQEESYTSKASFLNLDNIPIYGDKQLKKFSGYRYTRGMYKIRGKKEFINADVNGSYNILRKAIPRVFANGIEDIGVCPVVITMK